MWSVESVECGGGDGLGGDGMCGECRVWSVEVGMINETTGVTQIML